jgi:hypothetical protein
MLVKSGIPIIGFTGCVKIFLRRNDGNDASSCFDVQLLKNQYFYCCFPLSLSKIGLDGENAKGETLF